MVFPGKPGTPNERRVIKQEIKRVIVTPAKELRMVVREVLHLHPTTTNHLFYAKTKDGGLGLPQIGNSMRLAGLRAGIRMSESADPVQQEVMRETSMEWHMSKLASSFHLAWPLRETDLRRLKRILVRQNQTDWGNLSTQGHAAQWYRNEPLSNQWLRDDSLLGSWEFTNALRLRTDTTGTRMALRRENKEIDIMCRHCKTKPESLGHVLGECIAGKGLRIDRHNEIVLIVLIERKALDKGYCVAKEQSFSVDGDQRLKPDLVISNGVRAVVADVTVRYEGERWLDRAIAEKKEKYLPLGPTICAQLGTQEYEVLPVIVGSRGLVPEATRSGLTGLGVGDRGCLLTISLTALRTSIKIVTAHMDYT